MPYNPTNPQPPFAEPGKNSPYRDRPAHRTRTIAY